MATRYSSTNYFKKTSDQKTSARENFLQLYNRTCHRIYFYCYEQSGNIEDADMIFRDAFIYMHQHIAELRSSKSIDTWQKECVEISFRALLRSQLLLLINDAVPVYTASSTLTEARKEELWNRIIKMADIDPWRMVPVPGKSTIFSVIADQTISDLRYMSIGDIIKSAALILILCVLAVAVVAVGIKLITSRSTDQNIISQEIFLDDRYYADYNQSNNTVLSSQELESVYQQAMRYETVPEEATIKHTAPVNVGNTAGEPVYTEDPDINAKLIEIIETTLSDDMTDTDKLRALYVYVGGWLEYREYPSDNGSDYLGVLKDCFEYRAGTSLHYATMLTALCDAAGYRASVTEGIFHLNRNTEFEQAVEHYWCTVSLNGIIYHLDVEADSDSTGSIVREYYFMAADGNAKWDIFERDHEWK